MSLAGRYFVIIMMFFISGRVAYPDGNWTIVPDSPSVGDRAEIVVDGDGCLWFTAIDATSKAGSEVYSYDGENWQIFSADSGLMNNTVLDIAVSQDNFVWVLTNDGLNKYDGVTWTSYPFTFQIPPYMFVTHDLSVGRDGTVWCGFHSGVASFKNGVWTQHGKVYGLPEDDIQVYALAAGLDGRVCVTYEYIAWDQVNEDEGQNVYPDIKCDTMVFDGTSWIPTLISGIQKPKRVFNNLAVGPDGSIWSSTGTNLYKLEGTAWRQKQYLSDIGRDALAIDSFGNTWASVEEKVNIYDNNDVFLKKYSNENGLPGGEITGLAAGPDGIVWIVSKNGIAKYTPGETSVAALEPAIFALYDNFPNPFNMSTTIEYSLAKEGAVSLGIYNSLGQNVRDLISENMSAGAHKVVWDGLDDDGNTVSAGIYISRLSAGDFSATMKMTLLK